MDRALPHGAWLLTHILHTLMLTHSGAQRVPGSTQGVDSEGKRGLPSGKVTLGKEKCVCGLKNKCRQGLKCAFEVFSPGFQEMWPTLERQHKLRGASSSSGNLLSVELKLDCLSSCVPSTKMAVGT